MDKQPAADNNSEEDNFDINNVRNNWRRQEDFGLAYSMQQNEFSQHYDLNRFERRTMQVDTRLSKTEQKLEDKYAAEYYEQLRRDMEKEDERVAMELQRQLELEERTKKEHDLSKDEELARKMQEMEESQAGKRSTVSNLVKKSSSGNRLVLPPGLTPDTVAAIEEAQRDGTPLRLPAGITAEQLKAIRHALKDEDQRLAQEIQDYELAIYLQNKEKALAEAEKQRRLSQEQVQNLQNQTYVAATKGTLIDVATGGRKHHSAQNGGAKSKSTSAQQNNEPDLINFDEDDTTSNNFPLPPPSNEQLRSPPIQNEKLRVALPQPTVSLAGSTNSFSLTNPFNNSAASVRDPSAMGGVRVFPNNKQ